MEEWLFWLIAAVILAVGEIATMSFFLAPFAGGALVAAVTSGFGAPLALNLAVFLVISVALLMALRPVARSHKKMPAQIRTGTAALIGRTGVVVERISNDEGVGLVKIDGEPWTARSYEEELVIEPGARVHVVEIRGATALVAES